MTKILNIAVDAMGGEGSPKKIIDGIIHHSKTTVNVNYNLFGNENEIKNLIKDLGKKAGVSLNPETKVNVIKNCLKEIDLVLIMSVNPGFGGQKFMPEVLDKIKELKEIQKKQNIDFDVEIDGGINFENSKIAIQAGANILVSGTTIFKSNNGNIKKNINLLKSQ